MSEALPISEADVSALREQPPAPESAGAATVLARSEPRPPESVMPPPAKTPAPPVQSAHLAIAHDNPQLGTHSYFVTEALTTAAEKNLARYVGDHAHSAKDLDPQFIDASLHVAIREHAEHGQDGIKFCLSGDTVVGNQVLAAQQFLNVLKHHPATAGLFHGEHKPHIVDAAETNMAHVVVGHLTPQQRYAIVEAIASDKPVQPVVPKMHAEPAHGAAVHSTHHAGAAEAMADPITHPTPSVARPPHAPSDEERAAPVAGNDVHAVDHQGLVNEEARAMGR